MNTPDPFEGFTAQACPASKHPDWAVDSENTHTCPWCEIEQLRTDLAQAQAERRQYYTALQGTARRAALEVGRDAAIRTAALTEAADWLDAQCPPNPDASPESSEVVHGVYGCACESSTDLRRLAAAAAPTTTPTPEEH